MSYPASIEIMQDKFRKANTAALRAKRTVQLLRDASAAGNTIRRDYYVLMANLRNAIVFWNSAKAAPGMAQYAQDQFDDANLDAAAEFTSMVAAAGNLADWIFANTPTGPGGAALERVVSSSGGETLLTFTTAQTAGFRVEADLFTATIG